jgi:DNA-binding GntR family transcriptional regulator
MVEGVGNQHLIATYRQLVLQLGLLRQAAIETDQSALSESVAEHEKIVNALASGDEDRAVALVREHVAHGIARMRRAHERWIEAASSNGASVAEA